MFAQRRQDFFQRVRRVRVIHHHQRQTLGAAEALGAPRGGLRPRQARGGIFQFNTQGQQGREHRQQVIHIEMPDERAAQFGLAVGRLDPQPQPLGRRPHLARAYIATFDAVAQASHRRTDIGQQLPSEFVVVIDHGIFQSFVRKQSGLGQTVGRHVAVIIEMIARQVGEHRDMKPHPVHPTLLERVR